MRKTLVLALLLAAGTVPLATAQGYYDPPLSRTGAPTGPRVELDKVRAEIRWIDYLFKRRSQGDVLLSTGTNNGRFAVEGIIAISLKSLVESYEKAAQAGVVHPNGIGSMLTYWHIASLENGGKLKARRAELVKRDSELVALIRDPAKPPVLRPWELGRPPAAKDVACSAEGVWSNTIGGGSSTWTIAANGAAVESGMGNARGQASLANDVLTITFRTGAVAGVYQIDVFADCSGGDGTVSFTDGPPGFDRSSQQAEFTRVSGPSGAKYEASPGSGGLPKD